MTAHKTNQTNTIKTVFSEENYVTPNYMLSLDLT